ncbi:hypothetical protein CO661_00340 [Sinorhizobium fredii]|uniref:Uncharacterized protein n=1 Tax=Rhizobium fredii TaxID=380 RepID=A0A2A6M7F4_RHIFR|nr:hypothetical protein [Sinorhizobium fredii]PDT50538.1 hypothetical protein CO661_00340 [Sinorhizobium fredii]
MSRSQEWNRADAQRRIEEVLDGAKSGQTQIIKDPDGEFEVRFTKSREKRESAGKLLARGGPIDD